MLVEKLFPELREFPSERQAWAALVRAEWRAGLWVGAIAGLFLMCVIFSVPAVRQALARHPGLSGGTFFGVFVSVDVLSLVLRRRIRRLLRRDLARLGLRCMCATCDYDLTGNTSGLCPECGAVVPDHAVLRRLALEGITWYDWVARRLYPEMTRFALPRDASAALRRAGWSSKCYPSFFVWGALLLCLWLMENRLDARGALAIGAAWILFLAGPVAIVVLFRSRMRHLLRQYLALEHAPAKRDPSKVQHRSR
jgi:hypothetical protein